MKQVPFPKYIDRQKMFGPMELDEAFSVLLGVVIMLLVGFAFNLNVALALIIGLFLGFAIAGVLHGIKSNYPEGFIFHTLYRSGIYHPVRDNKTLVTKYPEVVHKGLKVLPMGFLSTLSE